MIESPTPFLLWWPTKLCPLGAVHVVDVVAVLCQVFAVAGIESQTVAAGLQLGHVVVALPVFVARDVMGVEAEVIRAFEALLGHSWNAICAV